MESIYFKLEICKKTQKFRYLLKFKWNSILRMSSSSMAFFCLIFLLSCVNKQSTLGSPLDSLNALILKNPNNPEYYFKRSLIKKQNGKYKEALYDILRALELDGKNCTYLIEGGKIAEKVNIIQAESLYIKATEKCPQDTTSYFWLCKYYASAAYIRDPTGYPKAIKIITKFLANNPTSPRGNYLAGLLYKHWGDTQKALGYFNEAISNHPSYVPPYIELFFLYLKKDEKVAKSYLLNGIAQDSTAYQVLFTTSWYFTEYNFDTQYAEKYTKKMLELFPDSFNSWFLRGIFYSKILEYNQAVNCFEKAIALDTTSKEAYYNAGVCHYYLKNYEKAEYFYRKTLSIDPQYDLAAIALDRLKKNYLKKT